MCDGRAAFTEISAAARTTKETMLHLQWICEG
jgi:hypothetical protein